MLCFSDYLVHLYAQLGLQPPTRFTYLDMHLTYFADRRELIAGALEAARPRYVVVDLVAVSLSPAAAVELARETGGAEVLYPWSHPIVFRSGSYLVYEIGNPMGRLTWPPPRVSAPRMATEAPPRG